MTRAAIYARLSAAQTDKEDTEASDSVANQLSDLRKLATAQALTVVGEYVDDGISGYKAKVRPGFRKLLTAIADGHVDVVLARHSDRLERNEEDGLLIRLASIKNQVRWLFASGMSVDPSTAEGGLLARILSAVAQFESQVKTERLKMHYAAKRAAGEASAPGSGAFGYDGLETHPDEAPLVLAAYEAVAEGRTVGSIVREWNANKVPQKKAGKGWTYAHLNTILKRPRNAGLVVYGGEIVTEDGAPVQGQWEPIVSVELWERVQSILNDPSRRSSPGFQPVRLSSGIARCDVCGMPMRSNTVSDKRAGTRYSILKCSRLDRSDGVRHPSARTDDVDAMAREAVVSAFLFGTADMFNTEGVNVGGLHDELAKIMKAKAKLASLVDSDLFDEAEVMTKAASLRQRELAVRAKIQDALSENASAHMMIDLRRGETMDDAIEAKKVLRERFEALHIEQKRRLVDQLLSIRVKGGRGPKKYVIEHKVVTTLNEES